MTTKKTGRIIGKICMLSLIAFVLYVVCSFYGNPISKLRVYLSASDHMKTHYANTDCYMDGIGYNFKNDTYSALIKTPDRADMEFMLYFDKNGSYIKNDYEYRVENGWNTRNRVNRAYQEMIHDFFNHPDFPYLVYESSGYLQSSSIGNKIHSIADQPVVIDREYNISEMAKSHGSLYIHIKEKEVSTERMAEILLDIKTQMDAANIPFYSISQFVLIPITDDRTALSTPKDRLSISNILYSDITEEDILEKVEAQIEDNK